MNRSNVNMKIAEDLQKNFMKEDTTCLVWHDEVIFEHKGGSIAPIADFWFCDDLKDAVIVDKVIGKASAMFMADGNAAYVHGRLMSEPAASVLENAAVEFSADEKVPNIINRTGDGLCPMESAVLDTDDEKEGISLVFDKMKQLGML